MAFIKATHLSKCIQSTPLLEDVSFTSSTGMFTAIVGPNGAGKSTLLRCLAAVDVPDDGSITVDDQPLNKMTHTARARKISYLPQLRQMAWPLKVLDVVALGRFSFGMTSGRLSPADNDAVQQAIREADLTEFIHRRTDTLSGGELARVHMARALAARAQFMLADEPIASLDPAQQFRCLDILKGYAQRERGVIAVLHDLELATRYADTIVVLNRGRIVSHGRPEAALTSDIIESVFKVSAIWDSSRLSISGPAD